MNRDRENLNLDHDAGDAAFKGDDHEPEIHADFSKSLVVDTASMEWQTSPATGVWRKRLELIGTDNPRLTTIVRFEPGSHFDEHGHPGGEEFLVLSGVFSDASGNFPASTYVRNPAGWVHAPWTDEGCELFVKLCQFQAKDKERVVMNTHNASWRTADHDALSVLPLHDFRDETVALYNLDAGTRGVVMDYPGGAEIFVLQGSFEDEMNGYPQGSWLRLPRGSRRVLSSAQGCSFYCKTGRQSL